MMIDKYYIRARLFPTVLTSIPSIVFFNSFVAPVYSETLGSIFTTLPAITSATFSAAIVFLLVQVNRFMAKELFQQLFFHDDLKMPSTERLLWKDPFYDEGTKRRIRSKIKDKYNIFLLSREDETEDELRARRLIVAAIAQIRISLRDNKMLLQHNIEYGFFRNLIGGSVVAVLFSILTLILAQIYSNQPLRTLSILLVVIYVVPIFLAKLSITRYGNYYSKILFQEFLSY